LNPDSDNPPSSTIAPSDADSTPYPTGGGIIVPFIAGLIVASALAYLLLSFALSLVAMLGLFFFMLFGLIIGATMYRVGDKTKLVARNKALSATVMVTLVCWSIAIVREAVDYPSDFAAAAIENPHIRKRGKVDEVRAEFDAFIRDYLATEYPPGGIWGYFKMTASGKPIEFDAASQVKTVWIKPRVQVWVWFTRGILSLVLLFFGIWSQVSLLTKPPKVRQPAAEPVEE